MRGLRLLADFEKWVLRVDAILLTILAEVSICADRAHVANTDNRVGITAVADDFLVLGIFLLNLLILEIVSEHLLEAVVTVFLNFLSNDSGNCRKFLGHKSASSIALAAGKSLLVHLSAVAFNAGDFFNISGIIVVRRDQQIARHISLLHLDFHLAGLILHVSDNAVAAHVTDLNIGLARIVCGPDTSIDHDITRLNTSSVAASIGLVDSLDFSSN